VSETARKQCDDPRNATLLRLWPAKCRFLLGLQPPHRNPGAGGPAVENHRPKFMIFNDQRRRGKAEPGRVQLLPCSIVTEERAPATRRHQNGRIRKDFPKINTRSTSEAQTGRDLSKKTLQNQDRCPNAPARPVSHVGRHSLLIRTLRPAVDFQKKGATETTITLVAGDSGLYKAGTILEARRPVLFFFLDRRRPPAGIALPNSNQVSFPPADAAETWQEHLETLGPGRGFDAAARIFPPPSGFCRFSYSGYTLRSCMGASGKSSPRQNPQRRFDSSPASNLFESIRRPAKATITITADAENILPNPLQGQRPNVDSVALSRRVWRPTPPDPSAPSAKAAASNPDRPKLFVSRFGDGRSVGQAPGKQTNPNLYYGSVPRTDAPPSNCRPGVRLGGILQSCPSY